MKYTEKYQLTQWEQRDRIQREPFNSDNVKIEAALAQKGNCQLFVTSYTGSGGFGAGTPTRVTFPAPPEIAVVFAVGTHRTMLFRAGQTLTGNMDTRSYYAVTMKWQGNTVSWHSTVDAASQMNTQGTTYVVAALYRMDQ